MEVKLTITNITTRETQLIEGNVSFTEDEVSKIVNKYLDIAYRRGVETAKELLEEFGALGEGEEEV